ncbi:MAG: Wzt carbohydrate-binding domain-containing protein, partial [Deltaproteobacteria bacterium]|nr:Wzt carbohydrate-binding domain-containing protein [Deltaproteobacteria bacterium]
FKEFNLGAGKYSITVAIHTGVSHIDECVHWMDGCVVFEIVAGDDHFFTGLVRLKPDLHLTKE